MSEQQDIDQIIRARLAHASVTPPPFVWDGVQYELRKKRRKRIVFWWWLGVVLGVAAIWGVTNKFGAEALPVSADGLLPYSQTQELSEKSNRLSPAAPVNGKNDLQAETAEGANGHLDPTAAASRNTTKAGQASHNAKGITGESGTAQVLQASHLPLAAPAEAASSSDPSLETDASMAGNKGTNRTLPVLLLGKLPALPNKEQPFAPTLYPGGFTRKNRAPLESRASAWLIDVHSGPMFAAKQLSTTANIDPEQSQYLKLRTSSEGGGWGFNGGIRGSYLFARHFTVGTGINYQQYTEVMKYKDPLQLAYTIENNGIDTVDATFGIKSHTHYNRFGYLDLPLSLGYEWRKGRMGIQARAGVSLNVWFWKKGYILNPDNHKPTPFGNNGAAFEPFRANAGLSAQGSIQLFWRFLPQARLFLEPYYQTPLHPLTNQSNPLRQDMHWLGVRAGATKVF